MLYNFDKLIDRHGTNAIKYDALDKLFGRHDLLPLWIADMEFEAPAIVIDAMKKRLQHPVLGYSHTPDALWTHIQNWLLNRHGWQVEREWIDFMPGIVKGLGFAVNLFVKEDEKVIIQPPVYHPFRLVPEGYHREVVMNPLKEREDGLYEMDFDNLEEVCDEKCKLLVLCNPHNPGGVCWSRETLQKLAHFAVTHGLIVISDEIHCDMTIFGHTHIPFTSVSDEAAQCGMVFGAPSKLFNIPGAFTSYCVIPNPELREKFCGYMKVTGLNEPSVLAAEATIAALTPEGDEWRRQMLEYVENNILFVEDFCRGHLPLIRPIRPEASFLVWLDCSKLGLPQGKLDDLFVNKAHLALNDGTMFGCGGECHMRLNVAEPRSILEKAMTMLKDAISAE